MITDIPKQRGRPRRFELEDAVAAAQRLFHARGYDAVNISDITHALGINPPSFYAAFGSKASLYARVLERYGRTGAVPLTDLLRADRPVVECLSAVLEDAAHRYAVDPGAAGCIALEGTHSADPEARIASCNAQSAAEDIIRRYIAARYPEAADELTDFVSTTMAGLSAQARNGHALIRLLTTARLAALALSQTLPARLPR